MSLSSGLTIHHTYTALALLPRSGSGSKDTAARFPSSPLLACPASTLRPTGLLTRLFSCHSRCARSSQCCGPPCCPFTHVIPLRPMSEAPSVSFVVSCIPAAGVDRSGLLVYPYPYFLPSSLFSVFHSLAVSISVSARYIVDWVSHIFEFQLPRNACMFSSSVHNGHWLRGWMGSGRD